MKKESIQKMKKESIQKGYDSKTVTDAVSALKQLPQDPPEMRKTTREVVASMADLIRSRIASGYTYQQISDVLSKAGIKISATTLRMYLSQDKANKGIKARKSADKTKAQDGVQDQAISEQKTPAGTPRRTAFQDPDEK